MKLARVVLRGVRGLPDGAHDLTCPRTGEAHRWVLVTGPSASGKTRFLEAIAAAKEQLAPYGAKPRPRDWIREGDTAAKIALTFHLDGEERAYGAIEDRAVTVEAIFTTAGARVPEDDGIVAVLSRYRHDHASGKLEYFPAYRPVPTNGLGTGLTAFEQRPLRLSGDARKYACVAKIVHELSSGGPAAIRFAELFARLTPACRFEPTTAIDAFPRCFRGTEGPRSIRELSSSELDAAVFAAVATLIGLGRSVALIDSPELFADPAFVPRLAEGLLGLGDDLQIIAATRSPELVRAALPGQIVGFGSAR